MATLGHVVSRLAHAARSMLAIMALVFFTSGCGAATRHGARGCTLTPVSRQLLAQIVDSVERELEAALSDGPTEIDVRWTFLGTEDTAGTFANLATDCTGQRMDTPSCSSPGGSSPAIASIGTCFQLGCKAAEIAVLDVYFTPQGHSISYGTTAPFPPGSITFDPSPLTRWTLDFSQAGALNASAMLDQHGSMVGEDGEHVDFSFSGRASGMSAIADGTWTGDITLSFPKLADAGTVEVVTHNSSDSPRSGEVTVAGHTLALVTQDGPLWRGVCGSGDAGLDGG
jgi:hypothetical protein